MCYLKIIIRVVKGYWIIVLILLSKCYIHQPATYINNAANVPFPNDDYKINNTFITVPWSYENQTNINLQKKRTIFFNLYYRPLLKRFAEIGFGKYSIINNRLIFNNTIGLGFAGINVNGNNDFTALASYDNIKSYLINAKYSRIFIQPSIIYLINGNSNFICLSLRLNHLYYFNYYYKYEYLWHEYDFVNGDKIHIYENNYVFSNKHSFTSELFVTLNIGSNKVKFFYQLGLYLVSYDIVKHKTRMLLTDFVLFTDDSHYNPYYNPLSIKLGISIKLY